MLEREQAIASETRRIVEDSRQKEASNGNDKAVKLEEDADTLNNLGFSLYQSGNYRAAVDRLKRAAKLAPHDERILNNLGLAYCRLGKIDEAHKAFTRATGPLTGNLNMAKMLERFAREDEAIRFYEAAIQSSPLCLPAVHGLRGTLARAPRAPRSPPGAAVGAWARVSVARSRKPAASVGMRSPY